MVFLHQAERDPATSVPVRWTTDLDVVVNLRTSPSELAKVHEVLVHSGFAQMPQQIEHRYWRRNDNVTIDILAPDHLVEPPQQAAGRDGATHTTPHTGLAKNQD